MRQPEATRNAQVGDGAWEPTRPSRNDRRGFSWLRRLWPSGHPHAGGGSKTATQSVRERQADEVDVYELLALTLDRDEDPDEQRAGGAIWSRLGHLAEPAPAAASNEAGSTQSAWELIQAAQDRSLERPHAVEGVRIHHTHHPGERETYILKHPTRQQLLRLTPDGFFLWQRLDGEHTVQDLAYEYLLEYGALAPEKVLDLIDQAAERGFLRPEGPDLYREVERLVAQTDVHFAWKLQDFFRRKWSIPNFDRLISRLYHFGGFLVLNRFTFLLCVPLITFGLGRWITEVQNPELDLLRTNESLLLGLLTYVVIKIFIGFLHELGQALHLKSLGREVPEGGIIWYYGIPFLFHNSNDIWLEPRRRRLFHSALGPLVELAVGSLAFTLIFLAESYTWGWDPLAVNTLFKVGMFAFVGAFFKLNPLIELNGYFLLVDILGVPRLMRRSFYFFTYEIWGKLYRREKFHRLERIYVIYFSLAVAWMIAFYYLVILIARVHVVPIWDEITGEGIFVAILYGLLLLVLLSPMLLAAWAYIRVNLQWFVEQLAKFVRSTSLKIVSVLLSGAAILTPFVLQLLPRIPDTGPREDLVYLVLARSLAAIGCAAAAALSFRLRENWIDVRTAGILRAIGRACVFLALAQGLRLLGVMSEAELGWGLTLGAAVCEVLAALVLIPAASLSLAGLVYQLRLPRTAYWLLMLREGLAFLVGFSFFVLLGYSAHSYHTERLAAGYTTGGIPEDFVWLALLFALAAALFVWALIPVWLYITRTFISRTSWSISTLPWLFIGVALSLFFVSGVFQAFDEARHFDAILTRQHYATNTGAGLALTAALGILLMLRAKVRFRVYGDTTADELNEARACRRLLEKLTASFVRNVEEIFGRPRSELFVRRLEESLNQGEALASRVHLRGHSLEDPAANELAWAELQRRLRVQFQRVTNVFIDEFGWPLYRRALANLHDGLYWQERELAHRHLLGRTDWGVRLIHYEDLELTPERKREIFARIPLFRGFEEEELIALKGRFVEETFRTGELVFRPGDESDKLYVVLSGCVAVEHPDDEPGTVQAQLRRGNYFGELALIKRATRTATARCVEPTVMLSLDRHTYRAVAERYRQIERKIQEGFQFLDLLDEMPIFQAMSHQRVREVATCMTLQPIRAGEVVTRQGELGESFFVVRTGRFAVIRNHGEIDEILVKELERGDYFGEIALLDSVPRAASVVALSDGEVLQLKRDDFDRLLGKYIALAPSHAADTVRRMHETRTQPRTAASRPPRGFVDKTALRSRTGMLSPISGRQPKVDNLDERDTSGRLGDAATSGTTTIHGRRPDGEDPRGTPLEQESP